MILATVNKQKNRMDMVSIPRDSLTLMRKKEDEGDNSAYFFDKITHAHAYNDVKVTFHINSERALSKIDVNPKKDKHKRSKDKTKHMNVLTKH